MAPTKGHEQSGRRPALVLSPKSYHQRTSLLIACPITSQVKGYPFEVTIRAGAIEGVVLADQIKNLDWRARPIALAAQAPASTVNEVLTKLDLLLKG